MHNNHTFNEIDRLGVHSMHGSRIFSIDKRRSGHMAGLFGSVAALNPKEVTKCKARLLQNVENTRQTPI